MSSVNPVTSADRVPADHFPIDVDPRSGRLLSVAELRRALQAAREESGRVVVPPPTVPIPTRELPAGEPGVGEPVSRRRSEGEVAEVESRSPGSVGSPERRQDRSTEVATRRGSGEQLRPREFPRGFGSRTAAAVAAWAADRTRAGVRPVVVGAGGGVGVSVITAAVASLIAAVGVSPVIAAEATRRSRSSLSRWLLTDPSDGVTYVSWRAGGPDDELARLPRTSTGLRVLDQLAEHDVQLGASIPAPVSVVVDSGSAETALAALSDRVIVLVARADPSGVDDALWALDHFVHVDPHSAQLVLVLNDTGGYQSPAARSACRLARSKVTRVVEMPQSDALRRAPIRIERFDRRTADTVATISHAIVDATWRGRAGPRATANAVGRQFHLPGAHDEETA